MGRAAPFAVAEATVPPPDWYMEQDARVLTRSRPEAFGIGYQFASEAANTAGNEVLASRIRQSPNISGVWGMTFGHYFARDTQNRDHFIEFSFWGLNNWTDQASYGGRRMAVRESSGPKDGEHGDLYSGYAVTEVLNSSLNVDVPVLNGTIMPGFDQVDQQSTYLHVLDKQLRSQRPLQPARPRRSHRASSQRQVAPRMSAGKVHIVSLWPAILPNQRSLQPPQRGANRHSTSAGPIDRFAGVHGRLRHRRRTTISWACKLGST